MNKWTKTSLAVASSVSAVICSGILIGVFSGWPLIPTALYGWRYLMWPGLLFGRVGGRYSAFIVGIFVVVVMILIVRDTKRTQRIFRVLFVPFVSILLYSLVGLAYVFWLPVPKPAFPITPGWEHPLGERWDVFIEAYEEAYRWGMIDRWRNYNGAFEQEVIDGWSLGYSMGISEWESIAPGHLEASFRKWTRVHQSGNHEDTQTQ